MTSEVRLPSGSAGTPSADEGVQTNGAKRNGHAGSHPVAELANGRGLDGPGVQQVPVDLPNPEVSSSIGANGKTREDFYAGSRGEEILDHTLFYQSDGTVLSTAVYFYGPDLRASAAHRGVPLRRKALYTGQVNPLRLYVARKIRDTFYAGAARVELKDRQIQYDPDGQVTRSLLFFYDEGVRAAQATAGSPLRRVVAYGGLHK
jgi:hypothetical protein